MSVPWFLTPLLALLGVILGILAVVIALRAGQAAKTALSSARSVRQGSAIRQIDLGAHPEYQALRAEVQRLSGDLAAVRTSLERLRSERAETGEVSRSLPTSDPQQAPVLVPTSLQDAQSRPVELDGDSLRLSRSLSALGSLVVNSGSNGSAHLYLNEQIPIDHVAYERWSKFFEFRGGGPYSRYRTVQPARIDWNEETGRGLPVSRGDAEVLP